jgi:hypothetical protein
MGGGLCLKERSFWTVFLLSPRALYEHENITGSEVIQPIVPSFSSA